MQSDIREAGEVSVLPLLFFCASAKEEPMKIIDQSVYKFSKNNNPFTDADPGELLLFKTMDCFSNRLKTEADLITDLAYSYDVAINQA